jgi:serine/threonine protein phosphatase PrpC
VGKAEKDGVATASAAWTDGARARQEDSFRFTRLREGEGKRSSVLLVVADGMGGQSAGDLASRTACDAFVSAVESARGYETTGRLRDGLEDANQALRQKLEGDRALSGMGTTLLGVLVDGDVAHWISVGDSILYLLRKSRLDRLNADHSLAGLYAEQVASGEMTQEEADELGGHNQLRSAVMGQTLGLIDQSDAETGLTLQSGDVLLLATDGILTLEPSQIKSIAKRHKHSPSSLAEALIEAVHDARAPHQDNTTVIAYLHSKDSSDGTGRLGWLKQHRLGLALMALALCLVVALGSTIFFTDLRNHRVIQTLVSGTYFGVAPAQSANARRAPNAPDRSAPKNARKSPPASDDES